LAAGLHLVRESRGEPSEFNRTTSGKNGVALIQNPRAVRRKQDFLRDTLIFERWRKSIESGIKARIDRRKSEPSHDHAFLSVSPKFCERWVECFRIKRGDTKASCSSI
jgi:hypothetical protein